MSESRPKMTPEAVAHREPLKDKSTTELFDSVSDLVDDRLSADSGKLRYKAGATIGEDGASKRVGGRFESRSQLEDVAAYESQIRLGMLAKEVAPAVEVVDTALTAAYARVKLQNERSNSNDALRVVPVIRRALVESGTISALEIGKLSDDEVTELISYARIAGEPSVDDAPDDVPAAPTLDTSAIDAHFGGSLPFKTKKLDAFFDGGKFDTSAIDSYFGSKATNEAIDTTVIDDYFNDTPDDAPDADPIGTHDTTADSPELEAKYAELVAARSEWARFASKRQDRAFDRGVKNAEYGVAEAKYKQLVREYGRMKLAAELDAAPNDSAKNLLTIKYLAEEQNELRDLTKSESDAKWGNRFARWMNKGSRKQRIARGILIGVVAGAAGAALASGAGAGLAAAGVAGAARFVRGYTARHPQGMGRLDSKFAEDSKLDQRTKIVDGDNFDFLADQFDDKFENDTKKEQNERKKAAAIGIGSVAAGATLGYLIQAGAENFIGGSDEASAAADTGAGEQPPADAGAGDQAPDAPQDGPELHELADAEGVYDVDPGEGWNETLNEMGVPEDQWGNVLTEAGPELEKQGWAYFDNANDEWRITKPGTLSEDAVSVLKAASANHGYSFN